MTVIVLDENCTGPNQNCRAAARSGRRFHVIDFRGRDAASQKSLVMPTNHYQSEDEGRRAIQLALITAPTVRTDADLVTYREQNVPYFLPVGWIDPTCRRS